MINLVVTIFGGLMIIAGFYAMSFGFATPPNILLFLLGLIMAVAGLFLVIIFSSGIEMSEKRVTTAPRSVPQPIPVMKARPKPVKVEKKVSKEEKKKETLETIEKIKPQPRIKKPKKVDRPDMSNNATEVETPRTPPEPIGAKEIKPKKKVDIGRSTTLPPDAAKSPELKKSIEKPVKPETTERIMPVKKTKPETVEKAEPSEPSKPAEQELETEQELEKFKPVKPAEVPKAGKAEPVKPVEVKPKPVPRIRRPVKPEEKKVKEPEIIVGHEKLEEQKIEPGKTEEAITEPEKEEKGYRKIMPVKTEEPKKPPLIKRPDMSKLKSSQASKKEDTYVKQRLERMKESYIQNTKDIESIIDERMDSFKGTLGKLKSESKEPGIIWSFDAGDVQEAMGDTISKANTRILMMYPWIRNIDVSILKKFMDTESSIIVQEASLDDDASVELLKLLQDKNVKIRTMPHVHTIAVVADDSNGLIISTDPIYESYEVGVIYKDQKSIEEIERMFEDAWEISQDVDLEIK